MLDYVIRNGLVVDGTGEPGRRADVGIRDGRIVAVGRVDEQGGVELDAEGLVVAPGIIDPHTHYDAQLFWDPTASPSNLHGVTTVIGGNCGFTLAPIKAEDHDYIRRMMAKVEGMPLAALEDGLPWDWTSFGDYLGKLEGNLGVNAGFLVGHCALRRWVMGDERGAEVATDEEVAEMAAPAGRVTRRRGTGLLVLAVPHPLRRGRAAHLLPPRRPPRDAGLLRGRSGPPGHHPRVHHQRLPRHLQRRRDRPDGGHDHHGAPAAQLEPAHRRLPHPGQDVPAAGGLGPGRRGRGSHRGADHAHPGAHEHELPHPLCPLPHPRLGRRDGAARRAAHRAAVRPGGTPPARRAGPLRGRRGVPTAVPLGQLHHR